MRISRRRLLRPRARHRCAECRRCPSSPRTRRCCAPRRTEGRPVNDPTVITMRTHRSAPRMAAGLPAMAAPATPMRARERGRSVTAPAVVAGGAAAVGVVMAIECRARRPALTSLRQMRATTPFHPRQVMPMTMAQPRRPAAPAGVVVDVDRTVARAPLRMSRGCVAPLGSRPSGNGAERAARRVGGAARYSLRRSSLPDAKALIGPCWCAQHRAGCRSR